MLTGSIDAAGLDDCRNRFEAFLEKERASHPHYGEFLDAWRKPAPVSVKTGADTIQMGGA